MTIAGAPRANSRQETAERTSKKRGAGGGEEGGGDMDPETRKRCACPHPAPSFLPTACLIGF